MKSQPLPRCTAVSTNVFVRNQVLNLRTTTPLKQYLKKQAQFRSALMSQVYKRCKTVGGPLVLVIFRVTIYPTIELLLLLSSKLLRSFLDILSPSVCLSDVCLSFLLAVCLSVCLWRSVSCNNIQINNVTKNLSYSNFFHYENFVLTRQGFKLGTFRLKNWCSTKWPNAIVKFYGILK